MTCDAQGRRREAKRLRDRLEGYRLAFARPAAVAACERCGLVPGADCARPHCAFRMPVPRRSAPLLASLALSARLSGHAR